MTGLSVLPVCTKPSSLGLSFTVIDTPPTSSSYQQSPLPELESSERSKEESVQSAAQVFLLLSIVTP